MKIQQRVTATKFKEQSSDAVLAPLYASLEPFYNYLSKANLEVQPHQCEGLQWCMHMETVGFPLSPTVSCKSGIVADDMGLGKTTLMLGLVASRQLEHTLIVVPLPLVGAVEKVNRRNTSYETPRVSRVAKKINNRRRPELMFCSAYHV